MNNLNYYRTEHTSVEAIQYTPETEKECLELVQGSVLSKNTVGVILLNTKYSNKKENEVHIGDYIVINDRGYCASIPSSLFNVLFRKVEI